MVWAALRPAERLGLTPLGFVFGWWDVADGRVQPCGVPPVNPGQGGQLDVLDSPPWTLEGDQLGLVETEDRLGQGVVVGVAPRADRGGRSDLGEAFGVADGQVLASPIGMVDQAGELVFLAGPD